METGCGVFRAADCAVIDAEAQRNAAVKYKLQIFPEADYYAGESHRCHRLLEHELRVFKAAC